MSLNLNRIGSKSHVDLYHLSNHGQDIKRSTTSLNKIVQSSPLINGKRFASSTSVYSSLTNLSDYKIKKPIKPGHLITKNTQANPKRVLKTNDKTKENDDESYWPKRTPITDSYRRLMKEKIQLESSFKILFERFNEAKELSCLEIKENDVLKEEVNNLKRKIHIMSIELQEARDQNELMEFRILESEQCQLKTCINGSKREVGVNTDIWGREEDIPLQWAQSKRSIKLAETEVINQKRSSRLNEIDQCLNNGQKPLSNNTNHKDGETIIKINSNKDVAKSCTSLESFGLTLSVTSEDEGLGDDGRRDQYSSPSSLSDLPLSDEEMTHSSEKINEERDKEKTTIFVEQVRTTFPDTQEAAIKDYSNCTCYDIAKNLQERIEHLVQERDNLTEQVLELEEAENDARLLSQRLQKQSENFVNQIECLQMSLVKANQVIEDNKNKIKSLQESEIKLKTELMISLISKSERGSNDKKEDIMIKVEEKTDSFCSFDQSPSHAHYSHHYADNKQSFNDLELFISEDNLTPSFGSSFHVQNINYQMPFKKRQNKSATPLCETAKPRKIEVLFGSKPDVTNPD